MRPSFSQSFLKRLIICWTDSPARDFTFSIPRLPFLCLRLASSYKKLHHFFDSSEITNRITITHPESFFKPRKKISPPILAEKRHFCPITSALVSQEREFLPIVWGRLSNAR
jgi:hypothetical protein